MKIEELKIENELLKSYIKELEEKLNQLTQQVEGLNSYVSWE